MMYIKLALTTLLTIIGLSCFSQSDDTYFIPIHKEGIKTVWALDFQELNEKIDSLNFELLEIKKILMNAPPSTGSSYMLREDHQKTKEEINELREELVEKNESIKKKESEIKNLKENLNRQIEKVNEAVNKNKTSTESETQNIKNFEKVVEAYIEQGLVSTLMTETLLEMDKSINSGKSQNDLLKYKELQNVIESGEKLFKEEFNPETVKNISTAIKSIGSWQNKSPTLFKRLKQLQKDVEKYKSLYCKQYKKIEDYIAADLADPDKKEYIRMLTNKVNSTTYPYLFQEIKYASKNLKNRLVKINCD